MLKRVNVLVAAAAVGGAILVAPPAAAATPAASLTMATPASAPAAPHTLTVSPSPVVVSSRSGTTAKFTFTTADKGSAKLIDPRGKVIPLKVTGRDTYTARYTFTFADRAGTWRFAATATKHHRSVTVTRPFQVRHAKAHRVTGLDLRATPDAVARGGKVTLSGTLKYLDGRGWKGYAGRRVHISFKPAGGGSYSRVTSTTTDRRGQFRVTERVLRAGWWRAEYAGAPGVRGSASSPAYVKLRVPKPPAATRIVKFDASPTVVKQGRSVSFRGTLQRWDHGWRGYGHQQVTLWFKQAGSRHWTYVKSTKTNGLGHIHTTTKAWRSGTWRVVFDGNRSAKRSVSSGDYVTVRR